MPAVARYGDLCVTHCSPPTCEQVSDNVFINDLGAHREGDLNSSHLLPCPSVCCTHSAPLEKGSDTVYVNGKQLGRIGDPYSGCTAVAEGSPDVFCG